MVDAQRLERRREAQRKYYERNRERFAEYYRENREARDAYTRDWREKNRKRYLEVQRNYNRNRKVK